MRMLGLGATILGIFFAVGAAAETQEVTYTDEMIHDMFKEPEAQSIHEVMTAQRGNLIAIQDSFLLGDAEMINQSAGELAREMKAVEAKLPRDKESSDTWMAMSGIVREAESMQNEILANDYKKAYAHYSRLIGQCVRCHQVARAWGKFQEPEVPAEPKKA